MYSLLGDDFFVQEKDVEVHHLQSQLEGEHSEHSADMLEMQRNLHKAQKKLQDMQVQPCQPSMHKPFTQKVWYECCAHGKQHYVTGTMDDATCSLNIQSSLPCVEGQ